MSAIEMAMVLAAGRGERLRPITDTIPKPLVVVAGKTMLDRMLDAVAAAGVTEAVVNTHHLADAMAAHLKGRSAPRITLSHEDDLLETGAASPRRCPSSRPAARPRSSSPTAISC